MRLKVWELIKVLGYQLKLRRKNKPAHPIVLKKQGSLLVEQGIFLKLNRP